MTILKHHAFKIVKQVRPDLEFVLARLLWLHITLVTLGHHGVTHGGIAMSTPVQTFRTTGQLFLVPLAALRACGSDITYTACHVTSQTCRIAESNSTNRAELYITLPPTRRLLSAKFTAQLPPMVGCTPAATKALTTLVTCSEESG